MQRLFGMREAICMSLGTSPPPFKNLARNSLEDNPSLNSTACMSVSNNKFDLKNFIKEQKSKLEDLYIVQLAKNIINFKKAKFEELKNFLEYKANRWENIITNEKSKIEEYLANTDIFDINNVKNFCLYRFNFCPP